MVSTPYVFMTLKVMNDFGISVLCKDYRVFDVPQGRYISRVYTVEGDASNASYFWAAAAVTGGRVCVENVFADTIQGDAAFLNILEKMGCRVEKGDDGITVFGPERLQGITVDMNRWPDIVPTLAVVAAQAETETVIRNVVHLRIKETDRLRAVATELRKIGAQVEELPDGLVIRKGGPRGGVIETYNDHRIAMSFAVAGLVTPDISIAGEECVAKSFPNFWEIFDQLYA
jgi:3-phosphoshikimate 1-carboxyvinyltransferase